MINNLDEKEEKDQILQIRDIVNSLIIIFVFYENQIHTNFCL